VSRALRIKFEDILYRITSRGNNKLILINGNAIYRYVYIDLKVCEIGELIGLDYSNVSVGRKRLRKKYLII